MNLPARSAAQRADALAKANAIRSARKELKATLARRGIPALLELLRDRERVELELVPTGPAGYTDTMRVAAALEATASIGRVKSDRLMRQVKASQAKTLGGFSRRQRDELVELLTPMASLPSANPARQENRAA